MTGFDADIYSRDVRQITYNMQLQEYGEFYLPGHDMVLSQRKDRSIFVSAPFRRSVSHTLY